jgi:hypothetical protein
MESCRLSATRGCRETQRTCNSIAELQACFPFSDIGKIGERRANVTIRLTKAADAVINDRASGTYARSDRIRRIDHHGDFYDVARPLDMPRCPQGRSVLVQAASSDIGRGFAARYAGAAFIAQVRWYVSIVSPTTWSLNAKDLMAKTLKDKKEGQKAIDAKFKELKGALFQACHLLISAQPYLIAEDAFHRRRRLEWLRRRWTDQASWHRLRPKSDVTARPPYRAAKRHSTREGLPRAHSAAVHLTATDPIFAAG